MVGHGRYSAWTRTNNENKKFPWSGWSFGGRNTTHNTNTVLFLEKEKMGFQIWGKSSEVILWLGKYTDSQWMICHFSSTGWVTLLSLSEPRFPHLPKRPMSSNSWGICENYMRLDVKSTCSQKAEFTSYPFSFSLERAFLQENVLLFST